MSSRRPWVEGCDFITMAIGREGNVKWVDVSKFCCVYMFLPGTFLFDEGDIALLRLLQSIVTQFSARNREVLPLWELLHDRCGEATTLIQHRLPFSSHLAHSRPPLYIQTHTHTHQLTWLHHHTGPSWHCLSSRGPHAPMSGLGHGPLQLHRPRTHPSSLASMALSAHPRPGTHWRHHLRLCHGLCLRAQAHQAVQGRQPGSRLDFHQQVGTAPISTPLFASRGCYGC